MSVSDIEGVDLRKLHRLTPVIKSWRLIAGAGALGIGVFRDELDRARWVWDAAHGNVEVSVLFKGAVILAVVAAISATAAWLSWRVTGFAIVEDANGRSTLLFHSGLFVKQRRQVRLDRVQAVDVNQPMVPRLAGLAVVQLDMAAGEGASVDLAYLAEDEAWDLRRELLRHTQGIPTARSDEESEPPPVAPDVLISQVSTAHLLKANLLDGVWAWALAVVWLGGLAVVGIGWGTRPLLAAMSGIIPVTLLIFAVTRRQVVSMLRDSNFRLVRTPTGIRISSGLTSTINKTIDFDRIQGVRLIEPYIWRRLGWARVMVDLAGAKGASDGESGVPLIPVADRAEALRLIYYVTGTALDAPAYVPAGEQARKLDPIGWSYLGVATLDRGVVRRRGRWRQSTSYVPYARVQSVTVGQGWLQRRLDLATVYLDLPRGAERWKAEHRSHRDAANLGPELGRRARAHRDYELAGTHPRDSSTEDE